MSKVTIFTKETDFDILNINLCTNFKPKYSYEIALPSRIYTNWTLSVGGKRKEEQHPLVTPLTEDYGVGIKFVTVRIPVWEESDFFF